MIAPEVNAETESAADEIDPSDVSESVVHAESDIASKTDDTAPVKNKFFSILKIILLILAVIGILGALIFGILIIRQKQEEKERMLRRQRREKRMKDWGYSSTDFDLIMQEHLRSKNQFKKRSFWDRFKR